MATVIVIAVQTSADRLHQGRVVDEAGGRPTSLKGKAVEKRLEQIEQKRIAELEESQKNNTRVLDI